MAKDYTSEVRALSMALRSMHRALLDADIGEARHPESRRARATTAVQRMQRLLHDPSLAWLKPVSDLMVELDQALSASDGIDRAQARDARRKAEALFGPYDSEGQHAVQRAMANLTYAHPKVTMALGDLRRALGRLPPSD